MKHDIETEEDVRALVDAFYSLVKCDDVIGYFFNEVAHVEWDEHLPVMYQFWSSLLLGAGDYQGNPLMKHLALNLKERLEERHFDRWIQLWDRTIDDRFSGTIANSAKLRARRIKGVMLSHLNSPLSVTGYPST